MVETTCAACGKLVVNPIEVKIGGKTVEVCCDECAQKLKHTFPQQHRGKGESCTETKWLQAFMTSSGGLGGPPLSCWSEH
jgi:hypothetical protein